MPDFPFSYPQARQYYGPSLSDPKQQPTMWSNRPSSGFYEEQHPTSSLLLAGAGAGAAFASGYIPFGKGNLWDKYVGAMRLFEEYSPGGIFRTFQLSTYFSQFTSQARIGFHTPGSVFREAAQTRGHADFVARLVGESADKNIHGRLLKEGVTLHKGSLYLGTDVAEKPILKYASVLTSPISSAPESAADISKWVGGDLGQVGGKHYGSAYARSIGMPLDEVKGLKFGGTDARLFGEVVEEGDELFHRQFIGGHNIFQHVGRQAGAWGTEWVSRFNRLLEMPFETPPFSTIFGGVQSFLRDKAGFEIKLAVKYGSGLEMMGRLAAKYGLGATGIGLAYQGVDWMLQSSETLEGTTLGTGITGTLATGLVKANLLASEAADVLGLHTLRETQEELAPGSTSFSRLLAFPLMGAMGAAGVGYAAQVRGMAKLQYDKGIGPGAARAMMSDTLQEWGDEGWFSKLGKQLGTQEGLYSRRDWVGKTIRALAEPVSGESSELVYKFLGKMTPTKFGALLGAGAGLSLIAPFLPGALTPGERPEELEAIYSGEQEVAIRKGRWWEMGRCNTAESLIFLNNYISKYAKDITLEDTLVGSDGKSHKIKGIYTRHHKGKILKFSTVLDRNIKTGLTENHIVPVLSEYQKGTYVNKENRFIEFKEAGDIKIGDYVKVPKPILPDIRYLVKDRGLIDLSKFIKLGHFILDKEEIIPAQQNWYSKKIQKSRGVKIPRDIHPTHRLGRLIGYFLAEGNLSFKKDSPVFIETAHAVSEKWIVDDIVYICESLFEITPTVRLKTTGKKTKEGCWIVRICSSILARIFFEWFYNSNRQEDKQVPEIAFDSTQSFRHGIVLGYWRGDGHIDRGRPVISSSRKHLIDTTRIFLLDLGYHPTTPKVETCSYVKKDGDNCIKYRIGWNANPEEWGFNDRKTQGFIELNGELFVRIVEIEEEDYDGTVYDFEIDHEDHLLQNGTFLVHNSPWEGQRIKYFRPHWYPRMMMDARDKAIWGEDEPDPFTKFYKREFTYDLEKEHYADRPYPITSLPFEDVPFIGPLLASTIGRLIKPEVLMHTEEWMGESGVKAMPPGFGERRATELGEETPGTPISPYDVEGTVGEQAYRMTEMIGLPGFTMTAVKDALTGSSDVFDQKMQLESARRAFGFEREYWDLEIGGGIGTTEAFRRLYPHRRRQIPLYNPIANQMPDWLPGAGEKSPDFLTGDPYVKVEEGELRLPGKGYEARYPELEGLDPEDYPLIHKYKILADVAPYTDKFKLSLRQVQAQRKLASWTDYEEDIFETTQEQIKQRKVRREFNEYEYLTPSGGVFGESKTYADESSSLLATLNEMKASGQEEPGTITKLFGGYWELLSHNAETVLDTMTPVSPGAKLVHQRTAIEDYHNTMAYGTESAFWSHPVRDFLKPTLTRAAAAMGFDAIPDHLEDKRGITEYFDILEYVKYSRLSNLARMSNDTKAAKEFEGKKNETLFGLNPFTYNYSHIFRALPRNERNYFNAFTAADTMEERAKILEMVPDNEKGLYVARWKLQFKDDVEKARKAGILSEDQEIEADAIVSQINEEAQNEGMPKTKELFAEYLSTRMKGENYADWYRRTKLLSDVPLPGSDWVGWHPSVDLEDVKLKLVQTMGEDMHAFDLWPSRAQALVNKPFIDQEALAPIFEPDELSEQEMRARVDQLMLNAGGRSKPQMFFRTTFGARPNTVVDIEQDVNIEAALEKML